MNDPDFSQLSTFDDWAGVLSDILSEAREAIAAQDSARRKNAIRLLNQFQDESPNAIARRLDELADKAVQDVLEAAITNAITNISSRSSELTQLVKEMKAIIATAQDSTASIRADRAREVVDSATAVIDASMKLRQTLGQAKSDKDLDKLIGDAMTVVQSLRNAIEVADHS